MRGDPAEEQLGAWAAVLLLFTAMLDPVITIIVAFGAALVLFIRHFQAGRRARAPR